MSDPNDPLILSAEAWRREPHLFSCFSLLEKHRDQIRTFLVKIESRNPLRLTDGEFSMSARFNVSRVSAQKRALVTVGRTIQIVAKINQNVLSIWDLVLMRDVSSESLLLRRRVALLLDHVSLEWRIWEFVSIFRWNPVLFYVIVLVPTPLFA